MCTQTPVGIMYVCMYVHCTYACTYACMHTCNCLYACMSVTMYLCMLDALCMHVCMYVLLRLHLIHNTFQHRSKNTVEHHRTRVSVYVYTTQNVLCNAYTPRGTRGQSGGSNNRCCFVCNIQCLYLHVRFAMVLLLILHIYGMVLLLILHQ
jgi:hypothetical protein